MDFKQLESFITIAKLNSFSKAAEHLYLTQPTISNHIQSLEKELDTILFNRTNKKITLTKSGDILYEYAISILNKRDSAYFSLNEFKGKIEGILEISSSTIPEQYFLPEILTKFNKMYPEVRYQLMKYDTKQVLDKIELGEIDFGIVGTKKESKNLNYIEIFSDELVLIAPMNDAFKSIDKLSLEELKKLPLIARETGSGTRTDLIDFLDQQGFNIEDFNIIAEIESNATIKKFVESGMGVSFVSKRSVEDEIAYNKLKIIELDGFRISRKFYFTYHQKRVLSPLANTFKNYILKL